VAKRWFLEPVVLAAMIGLAGTLITAIVTVVIYARGGNPQQPRQPARQAPRMLTLDHLLDVLERHQQRATYGAVADTLGREPISLFDGYPRNSKTSWVVSKSTKLPTGTKEADSPPKLLQNEHVIDSAAELRSWLKQHP